MIYANNAGTSWPKPAEVRKAVDSAFAADPAEATRFLASAHSEIASFLGVTDRSRLLLTLGCTSALAVVLQDLPWEDGDVVVTSSLEHHAMTRPVDQLVRARGVVHEPSPYRPGAPLDLDFVRKILHGGRVRLVAVTAASNVTGEVLPLQELAELVHAHEALLLVDAAQTVGLLPAELPRLGADILVFAGHKGPLGPQGIGGLWAAPQVTFESPRAACEIGGGPAQAGCSPFPGYCDVGSANLGGALGLAAGMRWLTARGVAETGGGARGLAKLLIEALRDRSGVGIYGGVDCERTATVSLRIDGLEVDRAESFFRERGVVVRAGQHCAPMAAKALGAPEGTIRISFGPFNDVGHVDRIVSVVETAVEGRGA